MRRQGTEGFSGLSRLLAKHTASIVPNVSFSFSSGSTSAFLPEVGARRRAVSLARQPLTRFFGAHHDQDNHQSHRLVCTLIIQKRAVLCLQGPFASRTGITESLVEIAGTSNPTNLAMDGGTSVARFANPTTASACRSSNRLQLELLAQPAVAVIHLVDRDGSVIPC